MWTGLHTLPVAIIGGVNFLVGDENTFVGYAL